MYCNLFSISNDNLNISVFTFSQILEEIEVISGGPAPLPRSKLTSLALLETKLNAFGRKYSQLGVLWGTTQPIAEKFCSTEGTCLVYSQNELKVAEYMKKVFIGKLIDLFLDVCTVQCALYNKLMKHIDKT